MRAALMLADGKIFPSQALGEGEAIGEVILNTAVVGYQEMITDPANAGKILVLTYPLIGNYGVAPKFMESKKAWVAGLVMKEESRIYSNWQAKQSLGDFLKEQDVLAISAVDTRTLAVHLRQKGEMLGVISTKTQDPKELMAKLDNFKKNTTTSRLTEISLSKPMHLGKKDAKKRIAILDLGVTAGIIKQLENLGLAISILPYNTAAAEILQQKNDGLVISNGPEEDPGLKVVTENIQSLLGRLPILGIATGHQVLAKALGAKIVRLKIGHRGVNYPIHNPAAFKGEITVQNHGYTVETDSLRKIKHLKITAFNLNDRTVEEIESKKLKILGSQYNPACPGFSEVNNLFKRFLKML